MLKITIKEQNKVFDRDTNSRINKIKIQPLTANSIEIKAWTDKGNRLYHLGKCKEAIDSFKNGIKIDPHNSQIWFYMGLSLNKLNMYEEAIHVFNKAIEIDSNNAEIWFFRAQSLNKLGRYEDAVDSLNKAISIDPGDALSYINKGMIFIDPEKYEDTIDVFNIAIEVDPHNKEAFYYKACALGRLNRYDEEIDFYNKAIEIDPNIQEAWIYKEQAIAILNHRKEVEKVQIQKPKSREEFGGNNLKPIIVIEKYLDETGQEEVNTRDIVILANSRKDMGHCIAGKDIRTGEWVRLINKLDSNENAIPFFDQDISELYGKIIGPKLFECVKIHFNGKLPLYYQPENELISRKRGQSLGYLSIEDLFKLEDPEHPNWLGHRDFGYSSKIPTSKCDSHNPLISSLFFKKLTYEKNHIEIHHKFKPSGVIQYLLNYSINGIPYNSVITDLYAENALKNNYIQEGKHSVLYATFGIGHEFHEFHYILVVGLVPIDLINI